jgi:hypothetical protein
LFLNCAPAGDSKPRTIKHNTLHQSESLFAFA